MALEHALLVSLREKPAAGLELARRFEASIGFFWSATHQQIYKVLHRMAADGWVEIVGAETVKTDGSTAIRDGSAVTTDGSARAGKASRAYRVTELGEKVLAEWIAEPTTTDALRSTLAVKMRGASYGDRALLLDDIKVRVADHRARLAHYESLERRDYQNPSALGGQELDQYLVLRGGILAEQFWTQWLTEYLEAHS